MSDGEQADQRRVDPGAARAQLSRRTWGSSRSRSPTSCAAGRIVVDERHLHPGGLVHGGAWVALADSVAAWQTFRHLPPGYDFTTVEMKLNVFAGGSRATSWSRRQSICTSGAPPTWSRSASTAERAVGRQPAGDAARAGAAREGLRSLRRAGRQASARPGLASTATRRAARPARRAPPRRVVRRAAARRRRSDPAEHSASFASSGVGEHRVGDAGVALEQSAFLDEFGGLEAVEHAGHARGRQPDLVRQVDAAHSPARARATRSIRTSYSPSVSPCRSTSWALSSRVSVAWAPIRRPKRVTADGCFRFNFAQSSF